MKSNRSNTRKRSGRHSNKLLLYLPRVSKPVAKPAEGASPGPHALSLAGQAEGEPSSPQAPGPARRTAGGQPSAEARSKSADEAQAPEAVRRTAGRQPSAEARRKSADEAQAPEAVHRLHAKSAGKTAAAKEKNARRAGQKGRKGVPAPRTNGGYRTRDDQFARISNRKTQAETGMPANAAGTKGAKGANRLSWPDRLGQLLKQVQHQRVVLIPPTADWHDPVQHRAHHFAHAFARAGYLTFFMTPNQRYDRYAEGFHQVNSHLYVTNVPMRTFRQLTSPILLFNHPTIVNGVMELKNPEIVYDFRDYPGEVKSGSDVDAYTEHAHHFLHSGASLVLAADDILLGKARRQRPDTAYCPDGIDYSYFGSVNYRQGLVPEDISGIVFSGKPVIGYYGTFASWFDYDLLQRTAEMRPQYQFLLIGPDLDGSLHASGTANQANIAYLGAKPYEDVASYLPFIDAGIIPFKVNEHTASAFPLKMYEYMAAGRPVVTTELPKCAQHPYALTARNAKQFAVQLDEALRLSADFRFCSKLREHAKAQSWDARVAIVLDMLKRSERVPLVQ